MEDHVSFALRIFRPVLRLAPSTFLDDTAAWLADWGVQQAVTEHDTATIFDWIMPLLGFQGIGDHAASRYADRQAPVTWRLVEDTLRTSACPRLRSYWHFSECRYRKAAFKCAEPAYIDACVVPQLPLRKGSLSQAAVALHLFMRDVCAGDFVGWIDARLAAADPGLHARSRGRRLAAALVEPLSNIVGTGPKVWAMVLSDLLLASDLARERWIAAGASLVAVDSLVHAFLRRTGILARFGAEHRYGAACFEANGCADVIDIVAAHVDARDFNSAFPVRFPRFVEKAIWHFCAEGGLGICNARRIDDRLSCRQVFSQPLTTASGSLSQSTIFPITENRVLASRKSLGQ